MITASVFHSAVLVVCYIVGGIVVLNVAVALWWTTAYHWRYLRRRRKRMPEAEVFTLYPRVRRDPNRSSRKARK